MPLDKCDINEAELQLAIQIIEQRVSDAFEPEKYEDEYRVKAQALIQQKIEGQEIAVPPEEQPTAKVIDLMEALRASVGERGKRTDGAGGKERAAAAPAKVPKAPRKSRPRKAPAARAAKG